MTQTPLSAATLAQSRWSGLEAPNPCKSRASTSRSALPSDLKPLTSSLQFLIANLRLGFWLSCKSFSQLQVPNREWIAIFCSVFSSSSTPSVPPPSSLPLCLLASAFLTGTPRLEFPISPILSAASNFLIVTKCAFSIRRQEPAFSVIPAAGSRLQCGAKETL